MGCTGLSGSLFYHAHLKIRHSETMISKHNFNSGPGILPKEVFEQAAQACIEYENSGLSILEIGHRTPMFEAVLEEARSLARELMQLDSDFEILFLHGGASMQFLQIPMNLLPQNGRAGYIDAGTWGTKAIKEAKAFGEVVVLATSADKKYTYVPQGYEVPQDLAFFHLTSNNTIEGTQQHSWPETGQVPVVCDMSSDILSRQLDFNRFHLIYAGAQKNIGAAGVALVAVRKSILGKSGRHLPTMMDYQNHIAQGSMVNTPPVFAVYVCLLTLRWLKAKGGVAAMEPLNNAKAALLYSTLDNLPAFKPKTEVNSRSTMNVVWELQNPGLKNIFDQLCREANLVALEGHRTAGGYRASLYNALPLESVELLTELMTHFAQKHG